MTNKSKKLIILFFIIIIIFIGIFFYNKDNKSVDISKQDVNNIERELIKKQLKKIVLQQDNQQEQIEEEERTWYASSHHGAVYYYCDNDNAWQTFDEKYLESFSSKQELLERFPGRTLHYPCE